MKAKFYVMVSLLLAVFYILPTSLKADEVIVPDGAQIYDFIMGDTTSTGERKVPGRVYKLERGKLYIFTNPMEIDFDFYLVADDDDPDNPTRPPMLVMGFDSEGSVIGNLITIVGDDIEVELKNLLFQGVPMDKIYRNDWYIAVAGDGANNVRLKVEKCVFSGWNYAAMDLYALQNLKLYITDCVFRNLVQPVHPFGGQSVGTWCAPDSLVYVNNTFFNTSAYIVLPEEGVRCNYIKFDHNTIYTTVIDPIHIPYVYNAEITNNIFYGILAFGQPHQVVEEGWLGPDGQVVGIINLDTLSTDLTNELGITEADRRIILKNNVWYNPQQMLDYWASYKDSIPIVDANGDTTGWDVQPLPPTPWMNESTQAMFDDDQNYPYLIDENTQYADPQFDPSVASVVDSVVSWVKWFRSGLGWDSPDGPARQYPFDGSDIFDLPWPLPEKLTYSNAALLTAAENSFPVGDLNWFPDKKEEWLATAIDDNNWNIVEGFQLKQNYPNPFNPKTTIEFSIDKPAKVTLNVFNVAGEKIATLLNDKVEAGQHHVEFNGSKFASGVYFYRISTGKQQITKKMILLK